MKCEIDIKNKQLPKITKETLLRWSACRNGIKRFCELFPDGATLSEAIDGLVLDGHDDWGFWLFDKARVLNFSPIETAKGYGNSGDRNSGYGNSGDWNYGNRNSGDWNSGDRNSGDWNSGDWNSGDRNSGYFCTTTPDILVFNKPCRRDVWEQAYKPSFIFFSLCYWVSELEMTDEEKSEDPTFHVRGGKLRTMDYKEAWRHAWENADKSDRIRIKDLPNFDKAIFLEITGIDVDA